MVVDEKKEKKKKKPKGKKIHEYFKKVWRALGSFFFDAVKQNNKSFGYEYATQKYKV